MSTSNQSYKELAIPYFKDVFDIIDEVLTAHAMALSYLDHNITINCINPGWIHTGDVDKLRDINHQQHPSNRVEKPEDIARAYLILTDSANDFITGENLIIDGGMTRKIIYEH